MRACVEGIEFLAFQIETDSFQRDSDFSLVFPLVRHNCRSSDPRKCGMIAAAGNVFSITAGQPKCGRERGATHPAAKIRCLLGEVFDEMHLLFAPPLVTTKCDVGPGASQEKRPDA